MMMIRKKILSLSIIAIIFTVGFIFFVTSTSAYPLNKDLNGVNDLQKSRCTTKYSKDTFSKYANIKKSYSLKKQNLAVKINDINISREKIEEQKEMLSLTTEKDVSYDEVLKKVSTKLLLLDDAKNKNIKISFEEALRLSLQEKEIFDDSDRTPEDQRVAIIEYIKALGISEEDYWNDYHVKENQEYYTIDALLKIVVENAKKEGKLKSTCDIKDKAVVEYIDSYKEAIYKNSKKQILDNELKDKLLVKF